MICFMDYGTEFANKIIGYWFILVYSITTWHCIIMSETSFINNNGLTA